MKMHNTSRKGFTLLELLVAIGVVTLLMPVLFSIFFATLQSQTAVAILSQVKRDGDGALSTLEYLIKNRAFAIYSDAGGTTEVCSTVSGFSTPTSSATVYFADSAGTLFSFALDGNRIASYSASISPNPAYLTSTKVVASNFSISCNRTSSFSPPIVSVSFTVANPASATRHEEKATLNYQTKIKLRSY